MTPEEREKLASVRFAILSAARVSGITLMLFGLWIWHGNLLDEGGNAVVGAIVFFLGFFETLLLPQILARRWRTPPEA